jgi:hypothetical protein
MGHQKLDGRHIATHCCSVNNRYTCGTEVREHWEESLTVDADVGVDLASLVQKKGEGANGAWVGILQCVEKRIYPFPLLLWG